MSDYIKEILVQFGINFAKRGIDYAVSYFVVDLLGLDPRLKTYLKNPSYRASVMKNVQRYLPRLKEAFYVDAVDLLISLGALGAEAVAPYLAPYIKAAQEVAEATAGRKVDYFRKHLKDRGIVKTIPIAIWEVLSEFDPTEIMDLLPAYLINEIYFMREDILKGAKAEGSAKPYAKKVRTQAEARYGYAPGVAISLGLVFGV
ncbi:MAG: hypothetical protein J4428_04740 [Candidatus Aenigmarchaeota archaeon]|nr:hypothetical protein [Candidatus Aenigmarchaeota archaeon]